MTSDTSLNEKNCVDDEARSSSKFFERLSRNPVIDRYVTHGVVSYRRLKRATPPMIQIGVRLIEVTLLKFLVFVIPHWHPLPLPAPLRHADDIACAALDTAEEVYNSSIVQRLKAWVLGDVTVRSDEDYVSRLLKFANETKAMATGEMKNTVRAFLEIQIGLFDRIEKAVESLYKRPKEEDSAENAASDTKEPEDPTSRIDRIKFIFEDVMGQRNILNYLCGDPNPLEPAWTYLHTVVQSLTSEETAIEDLGVKIQRMKSVLFSTLEYIEVATENQKRTTDGPSDFFSRIIAMIFALVPESALSCLRQSTTYNAVVRRLSQTLDTVDSKNLVAINVNTGTPRQLKRRIGRVHLLGYQDPRDFLTVKKDWNGNESGGSSESLSGVENSSDPGDRATRASRARRRRKKASEKESNSL